MAQKPARLIDADTFYIPSHGSARLAGIDAPEKGQIARDSKGRKFDAGAAATDAFHAHLETYQKSGWTVCFEQAAKKPDRYGRTIVTVYLERGQKRQDACAWMVRNGWAVAEYGPPHYHQEERRARRERLGLWAGEWMRPKDWRNAHKGTSPRRPTRKYRPAGTGLLSLLRALSRLLRILR